KLSDHCPIILKDMEYDFGPKPFRVFDTWLTDGDINNVFRSAWNKPDGSTRVDCIRKKDATMWELKAEKRVLNNVEMDLWLKARKEWIEKENEQVGILRQKARIKWDIEGDENSKYFHTMIRSRNNKNNIRGLMIDGVWCKEPDRKKEDVFRFYKDIFLAKGGRRAQFDNNRVHRLSVEDSCGLEAPFTENKVWSVSGVICVLGKGRIPQKDVMLLFVTLNPKVADFRWVLETTRPKSNRVFLQNHSKINGSPTKEFSMERGVRQGDPLSPFLFILAAKGLNALMKEAVSRNIFKGIKVGDDELMVSHPYASDTIIFGRLESKIAKDLKNILKKL
ncbi:hypothetical protein Tco_1071777, partial [Tanacetum coccineum]